VVIVGGAVGAATVNSTPLLATPPAVTTTLPVVAPVGTVATMLVALQFVALATVPLNVTLLVSCDVPKFVPLIVTEVPTGPEAGLKLVIVGPVVPVPPPPAALTAASTMPQLSEAAIDALAEAGPAAV